MSARLPSRWLFAAALLAAEGLTSAAVAQSPDPLADPPIRPAPQTAPAPAPTHVLPARLYVEPLLLEEEQVSEHGDRPHAAPPVMPAPPRVFRSCGLPECDGDDGKMPPEEVTLRCLLFSINPLAAFLPLRVEAQTEPLPPAAYVQHPPQYIPPSPAFPQVGAKPVPELVVMPQEVERLQAMPTEVERLDVMPVEEESEPQYELLAPWTDYTRLFNLPTWPLAEIQVSVQEAQTGSVLFGVGAEVSRTGTITVTAEPLSEVEANVTAPPQPPVVVAQASPPCEKQVLLRCTLASVNRTAAREIGLGFTVGSKNHGTGFSDTNGVTPNPPLIIDNGRSSLLINALRTNGMARNLAEPTLVTLSGRPATFTTTGDAAGPWTAGVGLEGVWSQPFGLVLTFTPSITDKDRVRLTLDTTVTTWTVTGGFDSRKGNTEVETRVGQTFALGGLLPADPGARRRAAMFAGLPLIGELFHVETTSPLDYDLVLLVTPEVVKPQQAAPAAQTAPPPVPAACQDSVRRTEAPQVQLNLLVAEVKGKAARKLKLDRRADGKAPGWVIEIADESRQKALEAGLTGLREKGHAKLLAEPRLVTLSGQQASFLSGGEQAIPVVAGLGQVGARFEEFGTRVTCQPVVLAGGTIRLEVEPEISELCEVAGGTAKGVIVPGRSSQRVHTTADVPPGHTLVITGPKAGGDTRLVIFVTPTVVETPTVGAVSIERRIVVLMNQSEHFGPPDYESERAAKVDESSHPLPERVRGGVGGGDEETVHDLLVKCQRELSRGHYAAAEDMAQQALERDRKQVAADPLVRESDLLQRVKAIAALPLGTVDPCAAKGAGGGIVPAGAAKAIGSDERIVEALMQEFNTAYQQGKYREAEVLAESARKLDPDNAAAVAALKMAALQMSLPQHAGPAGRIVATLTVQSRNDFKEGRYEEARNAALRALSVAPGDPAALALAHLAAEALARQPRPESVPQCTYVGTNVRPILPPVDPAVVGALQKILIEGDKGGPFGGTEEAEPKDDGSKPAPRR